MNARSQLVATENRLTVLARQLCQAAQALEGDDDFDDAVAEDFRELRRHLYRFRRRVLQPLEETHEYKAGTIPMPD